MTAATLSIAQAQAALEDEVRQFTADDPGRSVAVATLDGPVLHTDAAAHVVRPGASFLKVLAAVALYRAAARGEVDLNSMVPRSELGYTRFPSILQAFEDDRLLTVREVCALSLMTSDNSAGQYIINLVGVAQVNRTGQDLGLQETSLVVGFEDEHLGPSGRRNVTTAHEALRLIVHVENAPELGDLRQFLINNQRDSRLPLRLDDEVPIMHKTGSLDGVANDVGVIHLRTGRVAVAYICDRQPDAALTAIAIGDSALRIADIVTRLRPVRVAPASSQTHLRTSSDRPSSASPPSKYGDR